MAAETQSSYTATAYQDSSFEIIGERQEQGDFVPMSMEVLPSDAKLTADPMFADYGGLPPQSEAPKRLHLPSELAASEIEKAKEKKNEPERIALTHEEIAKLKEEALQAGVAKGIEQAKEQHETQLRQIDEHLGVVLKDINQQLKHRLQEVEKQAVQLALNIAQKIITFAVEINPEYILDIVRKALEQSGTAVIKKVRVSPEDMEFINVIGVRKQLKEFDGTWDFEGDETVKAGCVVETSAGEIDYRLDAAWERVRDNVLKVLR